MTSGLFLLLLLPAAVWAVVATVAVLAYRQRPDRTPPSVFHDSGWWPWPDEEAGR